MNVLLAQGSTSHCTQGVWEGNKVTIEKTTRSYSGSNDSNKVHKQKQRVPRNELRISAICTSAHGNISRGCRISQRNPEPQGGCMNWR